MAYCLKLIKMKMITTMTQKELGDLILVNDMTMILSELLAVEKQLAYSAVVSSLWLTMIEEEMGYPTWEEKDNKKEKMKMMRMMRMMRMMMMK